MKALDRLVSDNKIFQNCILKTYFETLWPTYAIRTIWIIFEGNHLGTIPVEFGQIPISGSREVIRSFPYIIHCKIVTPRAGSILTPGANFGRGPLDDAIFFFPFFFANICTYISINILKYNTSLKTFLDIIYMYIFLYHKTLLFLHTTYNGVM